MSRLSYCQDFCIGKVHAVESRVRNGEQPKVGSTNTRVGCRVALRSCVWIRLGFTLTGQLSRKIPAVCRFWPAGACDGLSSTNAASNRDCLGCVPSRMTRDNSFALAKSQVLSICLDDGSPKIGNGRHNEVECSALPLEQNAGVAIDALFARQYSALLDTSAERTTQPPDRLFHDTSTSA